MVPSLLCIDPINDQNTSNAHEFEWKNKSPAYLQKPKLVVVMFDDVPLKRLMTDEGSKAVEAKPMLHRIFCLVEMSSNHRCATSDKGDIWA